jgi:hypothetical protein
VGPLVVGQVKLVLAGPLGQRVQDVDLEVHLLSRGPGLAVAKALRDLAAEVTADHRPGEPEEPVRGVRVPALELTS